MANWWEYDTPQSLLKRKTSFVSGEQESNPNAPSYFPFRVATQEPLVPSVSGGPFTFGTGQQLAPEIPSIQEAGRQIGKAFYSPEAEQQYRETIQNTGDTMPTPFEPYRQGFFASPAGQILSPKMEGSSFLEAALMSPVLAPFASGGVGKAAFAEAGLRQAGKAAGQVGREIAPAARRLAAEETGAIKLPQNLSGAKPRYTAGKAGSYEPIFESDIDKALYIVAQARKSPKDGLYMAWLKKQFPDVSEAEIREMGTQVKATLKELVKGQPEGEINIQRIFNLPEKPLGQTAMPIKATVKPPVKEPWQMTWLDYREAVLNKDPLQLVNLKAHWRPSHSKAVEQALSEGKPVPPEVLKDYPELARVKPPEAAPASPRQELVRNATDVELQNQLLMDKQGKAKASNPALKEYHQRNIDLVEAELKSRKPPEAPTLKEQLTMPVTERQSAGTLWLEKVKQLDARNAPDSEYRGILSTGAKGGLGKDKTWRDKVVRYAENDLKTHPVFPEAAQPVKAAETPPDVTQPPQPPIQPPPAPPVQPMPPKPPPGQVEQVFKTKKFNVPPEQAEQLNQRRKALGYEFRDVKSFKEMQSAADEAGIPMDLITGKIKTKGLTSEDVINTTEFINTRSRNIAKLSDDLNLKPAETEAIQNQIDEEWKLLDGAIKKTIQGGTELGRAVVAYRIIARNKQDPAFWLMEAQRALAGKGITKEHQKAIVDLLGKGDFDGLSMFVAALRKPDLADKIIAFWKAGLLTGLRTHEINTMANIGFKGLQTASDVMAVNLDVLASLVTGERTIAFNPRTLKAYGQGVAGGIKPAGKYMLTGRYKGANPLLKADLTREVNYNNKLLDFYTKSVFRFLGAQDAVIKSGILKESLEKQAQLIAIKERLKGPAFRARVKELAANPTNEMSINAIDASVYGTFQGKNILSDIILSAKRAATKNKFTRVASEVVMPFVTTPTEIALRMADYSPLGFIKAMTRFAKPSNQLQKNLIEDLSHAVTGSGLIAFGAYLYSKGLMTGDLPEDKAEREQFYAQGKQPGAIYIGGAYRQVNRMAPAGMLLALGAELQSQTTKEEISDVDIAKAVGFTGIKQIAEQPMLQGISGMTKAVNDPENYGSKFIDKQTASNIPSMINSLAKYHDPYLRLPEGTLQYVQARLPFMSDSLPMRRDVFGQPVRTPGDKWNIIDPFTSTKATDSPVLKEAMRLDVPIGLPERNMVIGTKPNGDRVMLHLDNKEYGLYQEVQGKYLKAKLDWLISNSEYQNASFVEKQKAFKDAITKVHKEVKETFLPGIMIVRYDLPGNTNPKILMGTLVQLNKLKAFQELDFEKQSRVIIEAWRQSELNK